MKLKSLFVITAMFLTTIASAQDTAETNLSMKFTEVTDGIYMVEGRGGNIGLSIGNDGILMIDDQFANASEELMNQIKKKSKKPIQFLVNTHHHGDHTGGNANFAKEGAVIVSHENVRKHLNETLNNATEKTATTSDAMLPTITFNEDLNFYYNGEKVMVFHVHNAHTDGDGVVYFTESNVIHTGDVFFNGRYPYIDAENGGSLKGYLEALEKIMLLADADTKIIPGHGKLASKIDLQEARNMLSLVYKRVTMQYLNKKTEDEVAAMTDITAEFDAKGYGTGYISTERMLRFVYQEIIRERGAIDNRTMQERLDDKVREYNEQQGKN